MANPNIVNVTDIRGNTSSYLIDSTADPFSTPLIANAAGSNKIYKVNMIMAANVDGGSPYDITIKLFPSDDVTGTGTALASTITVPADSSVIIIDKNSSFYLLEDRSIGATAGTANKIVVTCSWEEIA